MTKLSEIVKGKGATVENNGNFDPLKILDSLTKITDNLVKLQGNGNILTKLPQKKSDPTQLNPNDIVTSQTPTLQPTPIIKPEIKGDDVKKINEEKLRESLVSLMGNIRDDPRVKIASMSQFIDEFMKNEGLQKQFANSIKTIYETEERK